MQKKITVFIITALGCVAYSRLNESKKRFLRELLRQVPALIPRYFV